MATTQNCTFNSVTLAAGEQFILPPGAEIVSTTNGLDDFTSTCAKPTSLETMERYRIKWGWFDNSNGRMEPWELDYGFTTTAINIGNIITPITLGLNDGGGLSNLVIQLGGGIITNVANTSGTSNSVEWTSVDFTTIPSIANTMYVEFNNSVAGVGLARIMAEPI